MASIGHVGKIDDFTIKLIEQHSFLLTGFSRHTSSRPSFGGTTLSTVAGAGRGHGINGSALLGLDTPRIDGVLASRRSKPSISDDGSLSDSEPVSSSGDDQCLSKDNQVLSRASLGSGSSSSSQAGLGLQVDRQPLKHWCLLVPRHLLDVGRMSEKDLIFLLASPNAGAVVVEGSGVQGE